MYFVQVYRTAQILVPNFEFIGFSFFLELDLFCVSHCGNYEKMSGTLIDLYNFQIGSFFMINLCLVVIATQFSETKKRETAKMKAERAEFSFSESLSSRSRCDLKKEFFVNP